MTFFEDLLRAACDRLDAAFREETYRGMNASCRGEVCETLFRDFLDRYLSGVLRVQRGGKIIDVDGNTSDQMDVVLLGENTLKILDNKGLYPVESVFGVFSVTSNLDRGKFLECVRGLRTIPTDNPQMQVFAHARPSDPKEFAKLWRSQLPYKAIFAFEGAIKPSWADELNRMVEEGVSKDDLPDLVIVNKQAVLQKITQPAAPSRAHGRHFECIRYEGREYYYPLPFLLSKLYLLSQFQHRFIPHYAGYFARSLVHAKSP